MGRVLLSYTGRCRHRAHRYFKSSVSAPAQSVTLTDQDERRRNTGALACWTWVTGCHFCHPEKAIETLSTAIRLACDAITISVHAFPISRFANIDRCSASGFRRITSRPIIAGLRFPCSYKSAADTDCTGATGNRAFRRRIENIGTRADQQTCTSRQADDVGQLPARIPRSSRPVWMIPDLTQSCGPRPVPAAPPPRSRPWVGRTGSLGSWCSRAGGCGRVRVRFRRPLPWSSCRARRPWQRRRG